jgi:hypothetical protein
MANGGDKGHPAEKKADRKQSVSLPKKGTVSGGKPQARTNQVQ